MQFLYDHPSKLYKTKTLNLYIFDNLYDLYDHFFLKNKEKEGAAEIKTPKPVVPSAEEILENLRARSAKLRAVIKINNR